VNKSGETLSEIVGSVKRVTDIIAEIAAASQEQSTGIDQVNRAVTQMDQVTQSNAAQTEELSSTAQALTAQAEQLQALVAGFKLGGAAAPAPATPPHRTAVAPKVAATSLVKAAPRPAPRQAEPALAGAHKGHGTNGHGTNGAVHAKDDGFEEF
jgi:methyl-accepting chemotaxis protein